MFLSMLWRHIREAEVQFHSFFTLELVGNEWLTTSVGCFTSDDPSVSLNKWLSEPHSRSGRFGEDKNSFILLGFELRAVQPVAQFLYGYIIIMDVSIFVFIMTDIENLNSQYMRHLVVSVYQSRTQWLVSPIQFC